MKLAVLGATGRMGSAITRLALADETIELVGATSRRQVGARVFDLDLSYTDDVNLAISRADVVIDFTLPAGVRENIKVVSQAGKAYVSGTTGLTESDMQSLHKAATHIPVFWAPNMSIGITVLKDIAEQIAAQLDESFDIEILEMHHRSKRDAPSGTALAIGECAARGRGRALRADERRCRTAGRQKGDIGFAAMRGGNVIADCSILFAGDEETIEIKHSALTRDTFAKGAIMAAKRILGKPAGMYDMIKA